MPAIQRVTARYLERFEPMSVMASLKDVGHGGAQSEIREFGNGVFPQRIYVEYLRTRSRDLPLILDPASPDHIPAAVELLRFI